MMQRVGGNDGVIPLLFQRLDQPQGKVPLVQLRPGHFLLGQLNHSAGEVLAEHVASLLVQLPGKGPRAKADVQHGLCPAGAYTAIDFLQDGCVSRKGVGVVFIGQADAFVIAIGPYIKTVAVQHGSSCKSHAGVLPWSAVNGGRPPTASTGPAPPAGS